MPSSRILLVAHDGSRTGAPILLLTFARWLKAHTSAEFDVLLLADGPLRAEFSTVATTFVVSELGRRSFARRIRNRLFRRGTPMDWRARTLAPLQLDRYATVYGNSIVCLPWLVAIKDLSPATRCVCAVHELSWMIGNFLEHDYVSRALPRMDGIAAGSEAVHQNLVRRFNVRPERIVVVHSFVESGVGGQGNAEPLRREFGVHPSDFVVVAIGADTVRKGKDLIAPIAAYVASRRPDRRVRFIWLGGRDGDAFTRMCEIDAEKLGVADQVTFVSERPNSIDFVALSDVFALPSREDPFPLVVLDAVRAGKPVVAFSNSGGMDELLADGAGRLVPYLDVRAFGDAILDLLGDASAAEAIAAQARDRVANLYNAGELASRLYGVLTQNESAPG